MKKDKSVKKRGGISSIFGHFEYPENMLDTDGDIVVTGDSCINITCCREIMLYRDDEIALRTRKLIIRARGSNLTLEAYNGRRLEIRGRLDEVRFERGGEGDE
ncbi:MAG: YabP/YqfC family sporulation protein [Eubacteriales bacterium]